MELHRNHSFILIMNVYVNVGVNVGCAVAEVRNFIYVMG